MKTTEQIFDEITKLKLKGATEQNNLELMCIKQRIIALEWVIAN